MIGATTATVLGTVADVDDLHARDFWDARAREDAYYFVDNRRAYGDGDLSGFWREGERDLDRLLEVLEVRIGASDAVVDIGCGVGRLTRPIARRAGSVYALDVSGEMIERARTHLAELDNVEWVLGDGHSLRPLPDASVDACISHVVFQHIPDPTITLGYVGEMGRVLRPGGWGGFQLSNDARVHRRPGLARACGRTLASALGARPRGQRDPAWLGSAVALEALRDVAHHSALEIERIVGEGTQLCLIRVRRVGTQPRGSRPQPAG